MKLGTVSPDLLIKLALVAGAIGLAWYAYRRTVDGARAAADAVIHDLGQVADAVAVGTNPANPENYINRAAVSVGTAVVSETGPGRNADGSWTPGAWAYDVFHPGWALNATAGTTSGGTPIQASKYDAMGNYLGEL